jgi:hypothetical protein
MTKIPVGCKLHGITDIYKQGEQTDKKQMKINQTLCKEPVMIAGCDNGKF